MNEQQNKPQMPIIVPAAGKGTRLRPVTRWVPKELLPVGTRPMIQHVLEEATSVEPDEVVVVVSPEKTALQDFLDELDRMDSPASDLNLTVAYQQNPVGLADALRIGKNASKVGEAPILSLLPDNLYLGHEDVTPAQRLLQAYRGEEDSLHLLHPVSRDLLPEYGYTGSPDLEEIEAVRYRVTGLPVKSRDSDSAGDSSSGRPERFLRSPGREIFGPGFFDALNEMEEKLLRQNSELDDLPVVRHMIECGMDVEAIRFDDRIHDVGHPAGMAGAWSCFRENGTK